MAIFLDAREPQDYAAGHIGNALNLPGLRFEAHFGKVAPLFDPYLTYRCLLRRNAVRPQSPREREASANGVCQRSDFDQRLVRLASSRATYSDAQNLLSNPGE